MFIRTRIKQNCDMKHCHDDFIAAEGLPEDFRSDSKTHRKRGDFLDVYIMVALHNLVNHNPTMSTRSLKYNAKENMKVLKEAVKPCRDGVAGGHQCGFQQDDTPVHEEVMVTIHTLKPPSPPPAITHRSSQSLGEKWRQNLISSGLWQLYHICNIPLQVLRMSM
jgi:hypothetical protein